MHDYNVIQKDKRKEVHNETVNYKGMQNDYKRTSKRRMTTT